MVKYKRPESVLVVIYCISSGRVLMLQRNDDINFWQSITGSFEDGESAVETAIREVFEETGIDIKAEKLNLINRHRQVKYEIFPQFRHRYASKVSHGIEHQFYLQLVQERAVQLSEHRLFRWLPASLAANLTKSWNNKQAIEDLNL